MNSKNVAAVAFGAVMGSVITLAVMEFGTQLLTAVGLVGA